MAILQFPEISPPSRLSWRLVPRTQVFTSPLSGGEQTAELPGARWEALIGWNALTKGEVRRLRAFVIQLKGRAGRFYLHDFSHSIPDGVATGSAIVNGSNQVGNSLNTKGWTPNTAAIMRAGDYFSLSTGELKMLTHDANSDALGQTQLKFEPPIRNMPSDGSALTLIKPACVMRLIDDNQDQFTVDGSLVRDYTLSAVEAFQ